MVGAPQQACRCGDEAGVAWCPTDQYAVPPEVCQQLCDGFFAGDKFFDELRPLLFLGFSRVCFFWWFSVFGFQAAGFRVSARLSCRSVGSRVQGFRARAFTESPEPVKP